MELHLQNHRRIPSAGINRIRLFEGPPHPTVAISAWLHQAPLADDRIYIGISISQLGEKAQEMCLMERVDLAESAEVHWLQLQNACYVSPASWPGYHALGGERWEVGGP